MSILTESDGHESVLSQWSKVRSYCTATARYCAVNTFFKPLDAPRSANTPLLVFVHGLGGGIDQFEFLIEHFAINYSCLAIDLPGCGQSEFQPTDWDAFRLENLASLHDEVIDQHRDAANEQKVICIAHSLGCSMAVMLASQSSKQVAKCQAHIASIVAICPRAEPLAAN